MGPCHECLFSDLKDIGSGHRDYGLEGPNLETLGPHLKLLVLRV